MQIKLMQLVDYYVGIPLCLFFSIVEIVLRPFRSRPSKPKKILFIELSEMGSAILAYSSIRRAQNLVGVENVFFLIFKKNKESLDVLKVIPDAQIITIDSRSLLRFIPSLAAAIIKLRIYKIDTCLDFELFSRCTTLISYLSGARIRAGFDNYSEEGLYRGSLITHRVMYNNLQHMALNFLALFESIKFDTSEMPLTKLNVRNLLIDLPVFTPEGAQLEKIQKILSAKGLPKPQNAAIYVLNPDPGILHLRGWPLNNFCELALRIINASPENFVVVAGLSSAGRYAHAIMDHCQSERVINLTGETANIAELLTVLSLAKCLITCDSGPAHMASLTNVRNVVLYGPESPVRYAPLGKNNVSLYSGLSCSPCYSAANHRHSICKNNVCMKEISVEQVWEAIFDE